MKRIDEDKNRVAASSRDFQVADDIGMSDDDDGGDSSDSEDEEAVQVTADVKGFRQEDFYLQQEMQVDE